MNTSLPHCAAGLNLPGGGVWLAVGLGLSAVALFALGNSARTEQAQTEFLGTRPLYRFEIALNAERVEDLRRDSRADVPASLSIDGVSYGQAAVHLKGNGSFRALDDKPSFTVDFAQFDPHRRFLGLRKVHLNNSVEDASYLREWVGSELFRSAGVPAPRVTHALVELNGRSLGLYVLKEGFAEEFLARHFSRSDGQLYERNDGWGPSAGVAAKEEPLRRLVAAVREPDLDRRWNQAHDVLDVEEFLSFVAMEVVACHWDGYSLAWNNFRVYHDLGRDKLVFLPTGLDQIFANPRFTWRPRLAGPVARALLETADGQARYRARVEALLNSLQPALLNARIRERLSALRPSLNRRSFNKMRDEAEHLCRQISQRYDYLRWELAQPAPVVLSVPKEGVRLTGWQASPAPLQGTMLDDKTEARGAALRIRAGPRTTAAWRCTVRLARGRYRFEALARVREVSPLPFGRFQGAGLRVGGMTREEPGLLGTSDWRRLQVEFEVRDRDAEVELICELRASGGEAWFAKDSLRLKCLDVAAAEGLTTNSGALEVQPSFGTDSAFKLRLP